MNRVICYPNHPSMSICGRTLTSAHSLFMTAFIIRHLRVTMTSVMASQAYTGVRQQKEALPTCHKEDRGESLCGEGVSIGAVHKWLTKRSSVGGLGRRGLALPRNPHWMSVPSLSHMDTRAFRKCCVRAGKHRQERSPSESLKSREPRFSFTLVSFSGLCSVDKVKRCLGRLKQQKPSLTWLK